MSLETALAPFPDGLRQLMRDAYDEGGAMATAMLGRGDMRPDQALMAGLALDPVGRNRFEDALQTYVCPQQELPAEADEVIVGGGAHAAIYAAVRRQLGFPKPLVLECEPRFGGTLAMTRTPSFYLNSRNRPGPLGSPGNREALNVIPGAPMQPSDIGGEEFQTNADLGLVVRCTLALNAEMRQRTVSGVFPQGDRQVVETNLGFVLAKRVLLATGLGDEKLVLDREGRTRAQPDGKRVLTYSQFMRRFDSTPFPLQGLGRVAVIGDGDSAKTVVEALAGYGPTSLGSVASLDYVERIDWYGPVPSMTCNLWVETARTRYKRLGSLFPRSDGGTPRVLPLGRATVFGQMYDGIQVNGGRYDTAIVAVGYQPTPVEGGETYGPLDWLRTENSTVRCAKTNPERTFLQIGAMCAPGFAGADSEITKRFPENQVALFRLASRTASAAAALPSV